MTLKPLPWYRKLTTKKGRLAAGAFLVEGQRAIGSLIQHHPQAIKEILTVAPPPPEYAGYPVHYVTEKQFHSICLTRTPQGMLAVVALPEALYTTTLPEVLGARILLLEDIQDPGNVGTLIRTAVAFDFSGVLLTDKCADPLAPKCIQATAGTVLSVWLRRTPHYLGLVHALQQRGYACMAADVHGHEAPARLHATAPLLLALGNEAAGLSPQLLQLITTRINIPISRHVESLNVAVCGAICMYLSSRQHP
jgi:TrmH family RNA methyltransferase